MKGDKKDLWYLDSGCSWHMTEDKTKFAKLKLKEEGFVTYGDNNKEKNPWKWSYRQWILFQHQECAAGRRNQTQFDKYKSTMG